MRELAFFSTFAKSFDFSTRASRQEFWVFTGICILLAVLCLVIDISQDWYDPEAMVGPVSGVYLAIVFLPNVAVSVRRLHDMKMSGWMYLINLIPLLGPLIFLVMMCSPGSEGPNRFGPDPYGQEDESAVPSTEQQS